MSSILYNDHFLLLNPGLDECTHKPIAMACMMISTKLHEDKRMSLGDCVKECNENLFSEEIMVTMEKAILQLL
jgi:hypothetical protein